MMTTRIPPRRTDRVRMVVTLLCRRNTRAARGEIPRSDEAPSCRGDRQGRSLAPDQSGNGTTSERADEAAARMGAAAGRSAKRW
jgi:hypothetical protein